MPRSTSTRTDAEWEAIIDRYLASGLSQSAFCTQEGISRFTFGPRYHRSPKFAGKRRESRRTGTTPDGFVAVRARRAPAAGAPPTAATVAAVTIRLGGDIRIECPVDVGVELIAGLARKVAR